VPAAALVASRGLRDNPIQVAALGDDADRRVDVMRRLFQRLFVLPGRPTVGAWDGDRLLGVAGCADPGSCQPSVLDALKLTPAILHAGTATPRMLRWLSAWAARDPERPHAHFGPLSVDPALQGRGIGSMLLSDSCRRLDEAGLLAHLETDKPENVRLYERFGYVVTSEADVLGVRNWFMAREPLAPGT
jgi:GNAT superfamily N-acetyltransferase